MENIFVPVLQCAALFALIMVFVIATFIFRQRAANKRQKELCAWALNTNRRQKQLSGWIQSNELSFTRQRYYGIEDRYPQFTCLFRRPGSNFYAYNIVEGMWNGRSLIAFDYHCELALDKDEHKNDFSAVIINSGILLKPLLIRPVNRFDKVMELAGLSNIEFESSEFSRQFHVQSSDKRWAYDVIHPRMMEYLLAAPKFTIQFDLTSIIACGHHEPDYSSTRFSIADFETAIGVIEGMLERFPGYLITQQKENLPGKNKGV